jgi:hypothetical protein
VEQLITDRDLRRQRERMTPHDEAVEIRCVQIP